MLTRFNEDDVSDKPNYVRIRPKLSNLEISELDTAYRNGLRSLMRVDRFIEKASELLRREGEMDNTASCSTAKLGTPGGVAVWAPRCGCSAKPVS